MIETSTGPRYLMRWDHSRDHRLEREIFLTSHRLAELDGLFGPPLADIIDDYPRQALTLSTSSDDSAKPTRRLYGELGQFSGREVFEMIRGGRLSLALADLEIHHPALQRVISRLYSELRECLPGLRTYAETGQLQISSPSTATHIHCDSAPIIHWNVRGCRRVWICPLEESILSPLTAEQVVSGEAQIADAFDADADRRAQVIDLEPGQMISIPQYMPHRVENADGMNVTLVTRHMTRSAERQNNVHRANRLLRPLMAAVASDDRTSGVAGMLKDAMVRLLYRESRDHAADRVAEKSFCLDPQAPDCVKLLTTTNVVTNVPRTATGISLGIETTTSTTPNVLEY